MPGREANVTIPPGLPELLFPKTPPTVGPRTLSNSYDLTEDNVKNELKSKYVVDNPKLFDPLTRVRDWFQSTAQAFSASLSNVFLIGDIIEVLRGEEDGDTADLGTAINAAIRQGQENLDNLVRGLFGWIGSGFTNSDGAQSIADQAATTAALAAAVATLQKVQDNYGSGGISAVYDFSSQPDSATLGSSFTQSYTGPGSTTWGVSGGRTAVTVVNDDVRTCVARYNVAATTTDYQVVLAAFAGSPEWLNGTVKGHTLLFGRMNAAGTEYVYADLDKYNYELGCVAGGVRTVFQPGSGFSFKSSGIYSLRLGAPGSPRIFQIMEGAIPIVTHVEVGTTSKLGASYRHCGMGETTYPSGFGAQRPAPVGAWAFGDNLPPTVPGSGFAMYRASTTPVGLNAGANGMPANFFDTPGPASSDFTVTMSESKVAVEYAGHYQFDVQAEVAGIFFPDVFRWALFVNGLPKYYGGTAHMRGLTSTSVTIVPACVSANWSHVELGEGDVVQLAYVASNSTASVLAGDAALVSTRFTGALTNRSFS